MNSDRTSLRPRPSFYEAWERVVKADPRANAVWRAGLWLDRQGLMNEVDRASHILQESKIRRGDRILLVDTDGVRWLALFLAASRAGVCVALFDPTERREAALEFASTAGFRGTLFQGEWSAAPGAARRTSHVDLYKVTSGSTGRPKLLPFTADQCMADGHQLIGAMGLRADDVNLAAIPLGHSYGLGNLVMPLVLSGMPLALVDAPLPHIVTAAVEASHASVFPAVPSLLAALVQAELAPSSLRSLRMVISAGGYLDPSLARAFRERFGMSVHAFYGSSETGGIAFDATGRAAEEPGGVVGRVIPTVSLRLGREGRVHVSGPAVMRSREVRLGDLAELSASGELRLKGRAGKLVKLGARRVDLAGLERELKRVAPEIRELYLDIHPERPERLCVAIVPALDKAELRTRWLGALPSWKVPARIVVLDTFPRTPRGKNDRPALRALLGFKPERPAPHSGA